MSDLLPDIDDRESTATLLLLAEILTKRGEIGPLARVIVTRKRPQYPWTQHFVPDRNDGQEGE